MPFLRRKRKQEVPQSDVGNAFVEKLDLLKQDSQDLTDAIHSTREHMAIKIDQEPPR